MVLSGREYVSSFSVNCRPAFTSPIHAESWLFSTSHSHRYVGRPRAALDAHAHHVPRDVAGERDLQADVARRRVCGPRGSRPRTRCCRRTPSAPASSSSAGRRCRPASHATAPAACFTKRRPAVVHVVVVGSALSTRRRDRAGQDLAGGSRPRRVISGENRLSIAPGNRIATDDDVPAEHADAVAGDLDGRVGRDQFVVHRVASNRASAGASGAPGSSSPDAAIAWFDTVTVTSERRLFEALRRRM